MAAVLTPPDHPAEGAVNLLGRAATVATVPPEPRTTAAFVLSFQAAVLGAQAHGACHHGSQVRNRLRTGCVVPGQLE